MARVLRLTAIVAVTGFLGASGLRAEDSNPAALATALKDVTATLQGGLKASEPEGKPISGKFELKDGKLQLSVYVLKGDDFVEVVADPKTAVAKSEKITDADDLKAAAAQKAAMAKAAVSLLTAADTAGPRKKRADTPKQPPAAPPACHRQGHRKPCGSRDPA